MRVLHLSGFTYNAKHTGTKSKASRKSCDYPAPELIQAAISRVLLRHYINEFDRAKKFELTSPSSLSRK